MFCPKPDQAPDWREQNTEENSEDGITGSRSRARQVRPGGASFQPRDQSRSVGAARERTRPAGCISGRSDSRSEQGRRQETRHFAIRWQAVFEQADLSQEQPLGRRRRALRSREQVHICCPVDGKNCDQRKSLQGDLALCKPEAGNLWPAA